MRYNINGMRFWSINDRDAATVVGGGRTTDDAGERETTISRGDFGNECKFIYS